MRSFTSSIAPYRDEIRRIVTASSYRSRPGRSFSRSCTARTPPASARSTAPVRSPPGTRFRSVIR
jgi:hypothetical protein